MIEPEKNKFLTALLVSLFFLFASAAHGAQPWELARLMTGADGTTRLEMPLELSFDAVNHRYFVVDGRHGVLMSFDEAGGRLAAFNAGEQIRQPVDLSLIDANRLWVVDRSLNQLLYIDVSEKQVRAFSIRHPNGDPVFVDRLDRDRQGRLLVLDRLSGAIAILDDNLQVTQTLAGGKDFKGFSDFKVKDDGIWALDGLQQTVSHFDGKGRLQKTIALAGELSFPVAIELDDSGTLYILDRHAGDVRTFDAQGRFKTAFLVKGKRAGQLWYPAALAFDWAGRLCIVDEGNARIQVYERK